MASSFNNPADRYSSIARGLHWLMALMIVGNLLGGFFHDIAPSVIMPAHFVMGLSVLLLTLLRFGWRLTHRPPAFPATMSGLERLAAHLGHLGLYALMLAMPITGWLIVSSGRRPVNIFGLFEIPKLPVEQSRAFHHLMEERHELLAWVMIGLVVIHVAAALRHHFIKRDGVLARMWY